MPLNINYANDVEARHHILAGLPEDPNFHRLSQRISRLSNLGRVAAVITHNMSAGERSLMVGFFRESNLNLETVLEIRNLMPENMSALERHDLLDGLERQDLDGLDQFEMVDHARRIVTEAQRLMNNMTTSEREDTVRVFSSRSSNDEDNEISIQHKFVLSSEELKNNPVKVILNLFKTLKEDNIKLLPSSIEYIDSEGIDVGGLTRGFVTTLTKFLTDPRNHLVKQTDLGAIPLLDNDNSSLSVEDQEKCLNVLGRFFSAALQGYKSISLGQHFDPLVFDFIFNVSAADLENTASPEVFNKLLKIYLEKELKLEEKDIESILQDKLTQDFKDTFFLDSKDELIQDHQINKKIEAILLIAKSMYDSLPSELEWDSIKGNSPEALRQKIQGHLSRESVTDALQILDGTEEPTPTTVDYIKKWITGADSKSLEKFVEAITGTKALTSTMKLKIARQTGLNMLPLFHTCFFQMDVSQYSNYDEFKEKLQLSLEHALAASGFQMG